MVHDLWNKVGLGLHDTDGALKRSLIDLENPSQDVVDADLAKSIHAAEQTQEVEQLSGSPAAPCNHTCFSRFGHCEQSPFHMFAESCARQFAKHVAEKQLSSGTLVKIAPDGLQEQVDGTMHFLGALCEKPLCHVLARATPTRQHLYCLLPSPNSLPHFETTHQIFQSCLQKHGGTPCGSFVEVFACSLPSLHMLEARALRATMSFKIKCAEKVSKREPHVTARLPFGLRPGQGKGRKQKPETKRPASGPKRRAAAKVRGPSRSSESPSSSSDSDCCTESDSDSGSGSSLSSDSDSSEVLQPPTRVAHIEEEVVNGECEDFFNTQSKKEGISQHVNVAPPQDHTGLGQSFFVKSAGFQDASLAASSRSICYHCNSKIGKGDVRFTYFYNTRKPSRYIHDTCVVPFAKADLSGKRKEEAVSGMLDVLAKLASASSSSSDQAPSAIKAATEQVLAQLV